MREDDGGTKIFFVFERYRDGDSHFACKSSRPSEHKSVKSTFNSLIECFNR
jgi:hypothetical protein